MPPTSPEHDRHLRALLTKISEVGYCLPGTLTERRTRCSSL
jgi:hypothetical protein